MTEQSNWFRHVSTAAVLSLPAVPCHSSDDDRLLARMVISQEIGSSIRSHCLGHGLVQVKRVIEVMMMMVLMLLVLVLVLLSLLFLFLLLLSCSLFRDSALF